MIIIIAIYFLIFIAASYTVTKAKLTDSPIKESEENEVSFIIPFKNEANRIIPLINSLNKAKWTDKFEIIFIDDHSTDNTIDTILNELDIPFRLLKLNETNGKKNAIIYGVMNAKHEHIHSLDADVSFHENYLLNISKLPLADLTILPVKLMGNSLFQKLNALEFQWLQTFAFYLAKLNKPMLCNGANLSFTKAAFMQSLTTRTDFEEPSGDDIYLLKAVSEHGGTVSAHSNQSLLIYTEAPANFTELISQRKRWIKKVLNGPSTIIILLFLLYNVVPFLALLKCHINLLWLLPIFLKVCTEFVLSNRFTINQFALIIIHQVYYPVYGLILLISLPFKGRWK